MTFRNSVVGGTTLVRASIQSPNYVAATSGWTINRDGSAEFSNITIRGAATGNTVIIGPASGSQILIGYTGTTSIIEFPMHSPAENSASSIFGRVQNSGSPTAEILDINLRGPQITTNTDRLVLHISSENTGATIPARLSVIRNTTDTMLFLDNTNGLQVNEPVSINTATSQIPLSINAPSSPGASLLVAKTGATTRFQIDSSGNTTVSANLTVTGIGSDGFAIKSSSTSRNTTTSPAADPHLALAVVANATYMVESVVAWTQGGGGMRIDWTAPTGATMVWTDNDGDGIGALGTDTTFAVTDGTTLKGALVVGGTAGTLTLRWAQNTSNAADTTLLAGCYLWIRRLA